MTAPGDPTDAERRDALARVLAGPAVDPDGNAGRILAYVVGETLAGRADRIKAVTIAQDVLGRGRAFDPARDSQVRVEAKRLREALHHHYATAGAADPVRIAIPLGGYVPRFERAAPPPPPPRRRRRLAGFALGATAAALAAALLAVFALRDRAPAPNDEGEPTLAVAIPPDAPPALRALRTAAEERLVRFRNLRLLDDAEAARYRLDLAMEGPDLVATLRRPETGAVIAAGTMDAQALAAAPPGTGPLDGWIGRVASVNGLLETDYVASGAPTGDFRCSVLAEAYFAQQDDGRWQAATDCLDRRAAAGADTARHWEDRAAMLREAYTDGRGPDPEAQLEPALRAARAAVAADPFDASAHYILTSVLLIAGADEEALAMGERAVALNPLDGTVLGGFAARLAILGRYERALELYIRARDLSPGAARWRDYGIFLCNLALGREREAAAAAMTLGGTENTLYLAARAIGHAIRGEDEAARASRDALLAAEGDVRAMYERRRYAPGLVAVLMGWLDGIGGGRNE